MKYTYFDSDTPGMIIDIKLYFNKKMKILSHMFFDDNVLHILRFS